MIRRTFQCWTAWIGFLGALFLCAESRGQLPESRKRALAQTLDAGGNPRHVFSRPGEIPEVIDYIHQRRAKTGRRVHVRALLRLGDEDEIKHAMQNYPVLEATAQGIFKTGQVRLIEHLVPTLFRDEPVRTRNGQERAPSANAGLHVLELLSNSWEMPSRVKFWASEGRTTALASLDQSGAMRDMVREWWDENETAMKVRDWEAVRHGRRLLAWSGGEVSLSKSSGPRLTEVAQTLANKPVEDGLGKLEWVWLGVLAIVFLVVIVVALFVIRRKWRAENE